MISVKSPVHRVMQPPGAFKSQKNNSCMPCVPMFLISLDDMVYIAGFSRQRKLTFLTDLRYGCNMAT